MKPLRNKGYFLEASTVSGILDKMQKADLIERTIDPNNRRNILVEATQKSLVIRDQVEAATIELNKTALQNLSNDDKVVLKKALSTIINNFQ
ncbi:MarR family winged helix-turn-helix transcriptional regulator [Bacillus safensis]|uniref:MarR family winged helix-turn-helix transcriptional regulator n=1 Tax=Bacillus TaxID=1386 RepID=UPI001CF69459|nr:MarR family transcriptional regulator [Bacillus safensis]